MRIRIEGKIYYSTINKKQWFDYFIGGNRSLCIGKRKYLLWTKVLETPKVFIVLLKFEMLFVQEENFDILYVLNDVGGRIDLLLLR